MQRARRNPHERRILEAAFEQLEARYALTVATGAETLVNTWTTGTQQFVGPNAIARNSGGSTVAVWESYNQDSLLSWGVYGQRLDASGSQVGSEFLVSSTLLNDQRAPSVAINSSGDFVIVWEGRGLLGALFPGIYAQRYNSSGVAQGPNIGVAGSLLLSVSNASVAMDPSGGFVVAWEDTSIAGRDISAQRYAANGSALGAVFTVNQTTAGNQNAPRVAIDASGNILFAWSGNGSGDASGVFTRLYNSSGAALTGETLVNTTATGTQSEAVVAARPTGGFLVGWSGQGSGDADGVFVRPVNASGVPTGSETAVNQTTAGVQQSPSIAMDPDGEFLVGWSGAGSGDSDGVFVREFWSDLTPKDAEMLAAATITGTQSNAAVAPAGDNAYVVGYSGDASGDASGSFRRLFSNDPPTIATTGSTLSYAENAGAVAIDAALVITDSDSASMTGATIHVASGYVFGQDVLAFTNQLGITGSWDGATGTLTLTGAASVAAYQAALRSITYANTSDNPSTVSRMVSFTVSDGASSSAAAQRTIDVSAINDPPTVTTTPGAVSYTENGVPVAIDPGLTIFDPDSATLAGATISIIANFASGQDALAFVNQSGIVGSWSAATGVLTLSGVATLAAYEAALRSITYSNMSDDPSGLARTIAFVVHDGTDAGPAGTRDVAVVSVNDAPTVATTPSTLAYTENAAPATVDSGVTVFDVDNATLSGATITISGNYASGQDVLSFVNQSGITGSWNPATGVLTLAGVASLSAYQAALRSIVYANLSDDPSTLVRTITFIVSDGAAASTPVTRDIAISSVNDAPTILVSPAPLNYTEGDGPVLLDASLLLADVDGVQLSGATITIAGNYALGEDILAFVNQSGIVGAWNAASGTLTLTGAASVSAYQTALRSITYANSSANPSILPRTITFVAFDGADSSVPASRDIAITAINNAPVLVPTIGTLSYIENGGAIPVDVGMTIADVDSLFLAHATIAISGNYVPGQDVLAFVNQSGIVGSWNPATGVLTLTGSASLAAYQAALRSITYMNPSDDPSPSIRTITFTISDGTDASLPAARDISVTPVNDPPQVVATSTVLGYVEGSGVMLLDSGITVSDVDGMSLVGATIAISSNYAMGQDVLAFVNQSGITGSWDAASGTLTLTGVASIAVYQTALRSITYANSSSNPATGTRTVAFLVDDGSAISTSATRDITITPVNDPPTVLVSPTPLSYTEGDGAVVLDASILLADVDNSQLSGATITISGNYALGQDVLAFVNQSGIVGSWNAATGTLTLTGIASLAAYQSALRSITYANSSDDPSTAARTVTFSIDDGVDASSLAARNIAVSPINDPPVVLTSPLPLGYSEGTGAATIDAGIILTDVDNATLSGATITISGGYAPGEDILAFVNQSGITGSWNPVTGVLTLTGVASLSAYQVALRSITYANISDDPSTLLRTITFVISDGAATSGLATRDIAVTAVNDPPTVLTSPTPLSYTEGDGVASVDPGVTIGDLDNLQLSGATIAISGNYTSGQDVLSFVNQSGITGSWNPVTGVLTLAGSASLAAYQAALRSIVYANLSDDPSTLVRTITFIVSDGMATSPAATRDIAVAAVNDPPTVVASSSALNYVEASGAQLLDGGITLSDPDSTLLSGATVTISSNYALGQDVLWFVNQSGINGSWNAATGILSLTGTASIAAYQAALRSITYANSSNNPSLAPRTVTFVVSDGAATSTPVTRDIAISPVNDAPAVQTSPGTAAYVENAPAVVIDPALIIDDPDSALLTAAAVRIFAGYTPGVDVLLFADQSGITGTWDGSTGTLWLSGVASVASYQAALRSIRFLAVGDDPGAAPRTIAFTVSDGIDASAAVTRDVSVTPQNDPPMVLLAATPASYIENASPTLIDPTLSITDPDSATLSGAAVRINANFDVGNDVLLFTDQLGITGFWDPSSGTLTLSGVASIAAYQAALRSIAFATLTDNPSVAVRTIEFIADDGAAVSTPVSRSMVVTPSNDAPIVQTSPGVSGYIENTPPLAVDPGLTISDPDSTVLVAAVIGIVSGYVPGEDQLLFASQFGIVGSWNASTGTLTLTGAASIAQYEAALRSIRYSNPSDTPATHLRTIAFSVSDGVDASVSVTRTLTVTPADDPPQLAGPMGTLTYIEGDGAVPVHPFLSTADPDDATLAGASVSFVSGYASSEDSLGWTTQPGIIASWNPSTGVLTFSGTASLAAYQALLRSVTYANSSDNPNLADRVLSFTVRDGSGLSGSLARTIRVTALNDAPWVATSNGVVTYVEDAAPVLVDPGVILGDPDSTLLSAAMVRITTGFVQSEDVLSIGAHPGITVSWDAGTGTLTLAGTATIASYRQFLRTIAYHNTSQSPTPGLRDISFVVSDGVLTAAPASRSVQVIEVNDPPSITTSPGTTTHIENGGPVPVDSALTLDDPDDTFLLGARVRISSGYASAEDALSAAFSGGILAAWNAATGVLSLTGVATIAEYQAALRTVRFLNISDSPQNLSRSIAFSVFDGRAWSAEAGRDVLLVQINDAPVLVLAGAPVTFIEKQSPLLIDPLIDVSDVDSATLAGATVMIAGFLPGQDTLSYTLQPGISASWNASAGGLTLTGVAPLSAYRLVLRSLAFGNTSFAPTEGARVVTIAITDGVALGSPRSREIRVAAVNDPPRIQTQTGPVMFRENDAPTSLLPQVIINDVDSPLLHGAIIRIARNYQHGSDQLSFASFGAIVGRWDSDTGALVLSGAATVDAYQAALRAVMFVNTSEDPTTAVRTVEVAVFDESEQSAPLNVNIEVEAVNDVPVITAAPHTLRFTRAVAPVQLGAFMSFADPDSLLGAGGTIRVSHGWVPGADRLEFTPAQGVSISFDPQSGTFTIQGAISWSDLADMFAQVTFATSDVGSGSRTFEFSVNDGQSSSDLIELSATVMRNPSDPDGSDPGNNPGSGPPDDIPDEPTPDPEPPIPRDPDPPTPGTPTDPGDDTPPTIPSGPSEPPRPPEVVPTPDPAPVIHPPVVKPVPPSAPQPVPQTPDESSAPEPAPTPVPDADTHDGHPTGDAPRINERLATSIAPPISAPVPAGPPSAQSPLSVTAVPALSQVQVILRAVGDSAPHLILGDTPLTRSIVTVTATFAGLVTGVYVVWTLGAVLAARRSARLLHELWTADLVLLIHDFDARAAKARDAA